MIADRMIEQQSISTNFSFLRLFDREDEQEKIRFVPYTIGNVQEEQCQDHHFFAEASHTISIPPIKTQWTFEHLKFLWPAKGKFRWIIIFILSNIMWFGALVPVSAHPNISSTFPSEKQSQIKLGVNQTTPQQHQNSGTSISAMTNKSSPSPSCLKYYRVADGETLSEIASIFSMDWTTIARVNHLNDPNKLGIGQSLCIPSSNVSSSQKVLSASNGVVGQANLFAFPQCTWWANERYHQIHGIYVPWATNANAWQWIARAEDFGWRVSNRPSLGSIIDLQPKVQGASELGHVGIVERVLPNGNVIVSNMNWGQSLTTVTDVEFAPGPGVSFITL